MKLLLYCTKQKPYLYGMYCGIFCDRVWRFFTTNDKKVFNIHTPENGKIIGECDFEVEEINLIETLEYAGTECNTFVYDGFADMQTKTLSEAQLLERSCLSQEELYVYLDRGGTIEDYGYAIHIKNLEIYDKPRDWNEMYCYNHWNTKIKNAPQNMMNVYDGKDGDPKILISVTPKEMRNIANRLQTAIVRRKVLKEMF